MVRGPAIAGGYLKGEGGKVLAEGGWFDTGDVGTLDGRCAMGEPSRRCSGVGCSGSRLLLFPRDAYFSQQALTFPPTDSYLSPNRLLLFPQQTLTFPPTDSYLSPNRLLLFPQQTLTFPKRLYALSFLEICKMDR
eukprot:1184185-Prorocentrum_minimum.AAC.1